MSTTKFQHSLGLKDDSTIPAEFQGEGYDAIIIGAGPAGATCAYHIKRLNPAASILIIDKAEFPRYKPCGGGISPTVAQYFDFDLTEVINFRCNEALMIANGERFSSNQHTIFMVRREQFDHFLLNKAAQRGVEVRTQCTVSDVEHYPTHCIVKTSQGDFSTAMVVLAEGGKGKLAKKLQIAPHNNMLAALEYEHYTAQQDGKLFIDFDYNHNGYAWNFPKADGLSLGIGGFIKGKQKDEIGLPKKLKHYVQQFAVEHLNQQYLHGHPIQIYSGRHQLVHRRIILIGEIAGCVDPLTAEGIRPAIKSGYLAAAVIADAITTQNIKILKKYDGLFHQQIGKDFQYARIMSYFLNNHLKKILPFISSNTALNSFMQVFSGKAMYRDYITLRKMMKMTSALFYKSQRA